MHDATQPLCILHLSHQARCRHLHHHPFARHHLQDARQGVVQTYPIPYLAQLPHQTKSGYCGVSAEVHLAAGREVAHGELVRAIPTNKSRLGIAQLGRHLLHQAVRWEVIIQQHHPCRVAAK